VQRVPVRIALDAQQLKDHPLRVGLSMEAKVDVSNTAGKTLADAPRHGGAALQTAVFDQLNHDADGEVRRIIAANLGRGTGALRNQALAASQRD
jgi:membrane fusion protein (multidrug efflux system)